jgi:phage regulator Rha-like protein
MNDLVGMNGGLTMTSLEIAGLTGKQHNHVLRDIRSMLEELEEGTSDQFRADIPVPGPKGGTRMSPIYRLPKRETLILVSGYSTTMRARIIDRWQELEQVEQDRRSKMSRLEQVEELSRTYAELAESIRREEQTRAENVLLRRIEPEPGRAHISVKDIKREYAPYLPEDKLRLVLRYYGQGKTSFQFGQHENASFPVFCRDGLESVFEEFLSDATVRVSGSRKRAIIRHDCFDTETVRVPKDLAVEWLDLDEDDFE